MPTPIKQNGFAVRIYTRDEHPPAHVHVWKAGGEMVIYLGDEQTPPSVRESRGLAARDERRAFELVVNNQELLLREWRRIHGSDENR